MTTNIYQRLRNLLPQSPLLIGRVLSINADNTSTIELPIGVGASAYASGVSTGSVFRARGTSVPAGRNAFVRDGVVESQAPDEAPIEIVVGNVVANPFGPPLLAFTGPIPDVNVTSGVPFSVPLASYFSGGFPPLAFGGTFPSGVTIDAAGGTLEGVLIASAAAVASATDAAGSTVESGAFQIIVA